MSKLHELQAEQFGARTGELYEYQYHQAANAILFMLDGGVVWVYCEWHDDFVLERADALYSFNQVKTRTKKQGPWRITDFFGTPHRAKKPKPAAKGSFFLKMFETWILFRKSHAESLFVTDNVPDDEFEKFLKTIGLAATPADLTGETKKLFDFLVASIGQVSKHLDNNSLFEFLKRFRIEQSLGPSDNLAACQTLIAGALTEASEVPLLVTEAKHIAIDLVSLVRKKSHVKAAIPIDEHALRSSKAVGLHEVLPFLSLSPEGYEELKVVGPTAVKQLSRLHRLCRKRNFPEHIIPTLCRMKAEWHVWWNLNRANLNSLDELALKSGAEQMLRAQNHPAATFDHLIEQAKLFAQLRAKDYPTTPPLTAEVVLGLILDLAARAQ